MYQDKFTALCVTAGMVRERYERDDRFFWVVANGMAMEGNCECCASTAYLMLKGDEETMESMKFIQLEFDRFELHDYEDAWHFLYMAWTDQIDPKTVGWARDMDDDYFEGEKKCSEYKRLARLEKQFTPESEGECESECESECEGECDMRSPKRSKL